METCKKHKCPDCSFCQFCSETRCRACRNHCGSGRKLSIQEQIALHTALNTEAGAPDEPIFYTPTLKKRNA